jgi:hypothetical protein
LPHTLRRLLPIVLAIALAAATLALAACSDGGGGGGGSSDQDAEAILKQTFSGDQKVDSGVLTMGLTAELKGKGATAKQIEEPVSVKVSGPFQNRGEDALPAMDLKLTASAGGQSVSAGVVSTGSDGYIDYQGSFYKVPEKQFASFKKDFERRQRKENGTKQPTLASLGVNPQKWLEDPQVEGDEELGGTETVHISAGVQVPSLITDLNGLLKQSGDLGLSADQQQQLPTRIDAKTRRQLEKSVKDASVDVWVGKSDKILRKLEVKLDFASPKGLTGAAANIESGKLELVLEVAELNEKQTIKTPKNAGSLADLQQQLGILGAGALGSSGLGGSGSSNSSPNTYPEQVQKLKDLGGGGDTGNVDADRAQKYLKCAEKANTVDALKQCGDLLK